MPAARTRKGEPKKRRRIPKPPATAEQPDRPGTLWGVRGPEDVFFQREAQVTWWTVLGGIAVAALLTQLESLREQVGAGRWHYALYFLASCFVIVNSWAQTAWGSLILRWPLAIPTALSGFFQGLAISVASLSVTAPAAWMGSIFVVILTAEFTQWYFARHGAWVTMPPEMVSRARAGMRVYLGFGAVALIAALHLGLRSTTAAEILWGIVALLFSALALLWQHLGMKAEKQRMGVA